MNRSEKKDERDAAPRQPAPPRAAPLVPSVPSNPVGFIPPHGGYERLHSYQKALIVYDATLHFCRRFIDKKDRTFDQMVQAARSGKQNIVEGSQVSGTSKELELKLTNVARASLQELLEDYRDFLRTRGLRLWDKNSREALFVRRLGARPDASYESYRTYLETRPPEVCANIIICLIHQTNYLLDQLTAVTIHNALVLAQAGVDVLLLDDDVAMPTGLLISPALWRQYFKPRLRSIIDLAREAAPDLLVFYHSDGDFTRLLPDLVEIGVNVINPVQPDCMDAVAIKAEFGDRMALWGTVGTASDWDWGTPDQIRAEVRQRIEQLGPAGLLLAPSYDIDFTPIENIRAFVEVAREYGDA